jgi:hypothetical protein
MISSLLTFLVIGFLAVVVLGVTMTALGMAIGLASFLLFKVAPLVAIGWLAIKLFGPKKTKQISDEDRKWLEG